MWPGPPAVQHRGFGSRDSASSGFGFRPSKRLRRTSLSVRMPGDPEAEHSSPYSSITTLRKVPRSFLRRSTQKFRHGDLARRLHAGPAEDAADREKEDFEIQAERPMVDVPHVQPEPFVPADRVPAVDLSPAGDSGLHFMSSGLLEGVAR